MSNFGKQPPSDGQTAIYRLENSDEIVFVQSDTDGYDVNNGDSRWNKEVQRSHKHFPSRKILLRNFNQMSKQRVTRQVIEPPSVVSSDGNALGETKPLAYRASAEQSRLSGNNVLTTDLVDTLSLNN